MPIGIETSINRDIIRENIIQLDLNNPKKDYNTLIESIGIYLFIIHCIRVYLYFIFSYSGNAQIVLIGEATHGTEEFYHERCLITQRLIEEKDFT